MDGGLNLLKQTTALRWTTIGLVAATAYICWPLWPALVLAAWTAALVRPLLVGLEQRMGGQRRAAATLALLLFVGVFGPLAMIVLGVVSGAQDLIAAVTQSASAKSALEALATGSGESSALHIPRTIPEILALVESYGAQGFTVFKRIAGAASSGFIALFIYFGGAFVFLLEGAAIREWLGRHSPLRADHLARMIAAFQETGRGLIVGIGLTAATQGAVATIAYLALGIPRWWVLGAVTGIASLLPLVGSALVWVPIALGLLLTGSPVKALILAIIGVGVIGTVDNLLRPVFSRMGSLQMPMFLLFVSVFGGMAALGAWGAFLGPLIVRLSLEALTLQREATGTQPTTPAT